MLKKRQMCKKNSLIGARRATILLGVMVLFSLFLVNFTSAVWWNPFTWGDEKSDEVLDRFGIDGMKIKEFSVDNELTDSLEEEKGDYDLTNEFKKGRDGRVKQDIYLRNKKGYADSFNFSTIIEIDYNEIRWNGTRYTLTNKPIKLSPYNKDGKLIVPNIFMDDVYHKRINYKDVGQKGGYALAYESGGKYYIELRIDDLNIKSLENYYIDPVYTNGTNGFSTDTGIGAGTPSGIATNGSDFWIADSSDEFVYHLNANKENQSDGFKTGNAPQGITTNGSDLWIMMQGLDALFHKDLAGNNISGGIIALQDFNGGSGVDITNNNSDFWVISDGARFIHHYDRAGANISGGFKMNEDFDGDRVFGIAFNETDVSFLLADFNDEFVYITDVNGNNQTGGFDVAALTGATGSYRMDESGGTIWISDDADAFVYEVLTSTLPTVTLNIPEDSYSNISHIVTFNCSATDPTQVDNISLIIDGVVNSTVTGTSDFISIQEVLEMPAGSHTWTCNATDNDNNVDTETERSVVVGYKENSQSFTATVVEGSTQLFTLNVTYNTSIYDNVAASLFYNGTEYSTTSLVVGDDTIINKSITIPGVTTKTNYSFYWQVNLIGDSEFLFNSTSNEQEVLTFGVDNCTTNSVVLYNFTIVDEKTQTKLNPSTQNTTGEVNVQVYTNNRDSLFQNYSAKLSKINSFSICINSSLTGGENYSVDTQVRYYADLYAKEYYHIQNDYVTNESLHNNITLYNLDNSSAQEFKIIYKDNNLLPVENALIQIQRKYIGEELYKVVEIPKTDANGETIANLELDNVIYTFVVTKNGIVLGTFSDVVAKCQTPTLSDCVINLKSLVSSISTLDFTILEDFSYTLSYNDTSRIITSIFSVPSGNTATVTLNATLADNLGTTQVCNSILTSASGTLTCTIPSTYGNGTAWVELRKDGNIITRGLLSMAQDPSEVYGNSLIFLSLVLFLSLIGIGAGSSPMIAGIFLVIGVVIAIGLNMVATGASSYIGAGATVLWIIVAIVIILIKSSNRT